MREREKTMAEQIPSEYLCPISMEIMKDPVVLCDDVRLFDEEILLRSILI